MTAPIDSPEAVARMLDGVTPGPWKCCETSIHGHKYGGCWVEGPDVDDDEGRLRGLLIPISGSGGAMSYTTRLIDIQDHDHNDANARFIAWAREAVPALAARLAEVEAVLEFYGDLSSDGPWHLPGEDYGKRARAALAGEKP
jgi:hypothetical protein